MKKIAIALLLASTTAVPATAASNVGISRFPRGIIQEVEGAVQTDDFVVANAGSNSASVTLTTTGTFFTVSPSSFTIGPNTSQTVTIRPVVSAGGLYDGAVNVFVPGAQSLSIPVRVFIGTRPQGSTSPFTPSSALLVAPSPGGAHTGATNVANIGNVAMQGILVADVPWIVPQQTNVLGVPSQGQTQISFAVATTRRPDGLNPYGAVLGNFSMIYLNGTSNGGSAGASVKLQVYDVSKVAVVTQAPPPLAAGEIAQFLPGVTRNSTYFTDVFLSNRGTAPIPDLRLFFTAAGAAPATAQLANFANFPSGVAAWFPFATLTLFEIDQAVGTTQVRSAQSVNVSISATRGTQGQTPYLTALPVLRSDRSIAGGDRLVLAGVEKSSAARTDVLLQETSGFDGTYTVDFFDAAGAPVSPNRSGSILPFGFLSLGDVVPAGARSARVTNTSSGAARLTAMATVVDASTGDAWTIIDASRFPSPAGELIMPMPQLTGAPPSTVEVWVSNVTASPISVVVSTRPPVRRRVVGNHGPSSGTDQVLNLAAGETRRQPIQSAPNGWIRISGPAGAFSATGRLVSTAFGRMGAFGTGVPAFNAAAATGMGAAKRFVRFQDAPGVSPPTLILVEAAHNAATVRATLRFNFAAGSTVSGQVTASKDYDLAAGQTLAIPDLTTNILGPQRASLGTLTGFVVDVEVVSGEGRILPFLQTIDGLGDLTLSFD